MTDRPILFSGSMIRAILREVSAPGTGKTQTRRVLKPRPRRTIFFDAKTAGLEQFREPAYRAGDRLWVREAWRTLHTSDCLAPRHLAEDPSKVTFEADSHRRNPLWAFGKLRPGMFMPRWASRLTLHVTDLRVQRLQEISEADARDEGVECDSDGWRDYMMPTTQCCGSARNSFATLWDSLNAERAPWSSNPWVVAVTFRPVLGNIDRGDNHD